MYRVSVIMPVYNNEGTLEIAVESILNQTMPGIELILINDGSTDRSAQICDTYAKKEPLLVEVIHQKHQGFISALNKGLMNSSGKYIYFASPTDRFDQRLIESNVNLAQEKDVDVVVFGFSTTNGNSPEIDYHLPRMPLITSQYEFRNHFRNFYHFYPFEIFNKIYKRDYLMNNRLKFQKYSSLSERFFNLKVFKNLSSVAFNRGMYLQRIEYNHLASSTVDHYFDMHRIFIQELQKMIQYWGYGIDYMDLVAEESYQLVYNELRKVTGQSNPLTYVEKIEHMTVILNHEEIRVNAENFDLLKDKAMINRPLLRQVQKRNAKGAIDLFIRKNESKTMTDKMKSFMLKLFD